MKKFLLIIFSFLISLFKTPTSIPTPTPTLSPTPTPTPRPLTFSEMNTLYGPCVRLPVLMYHHVQDKDKAKEKNQTALTVETATFQVQMASLKQKGYQAIGLNDLVNFFDFGAKIPAKSILLSFDDGYDDFYLNALPILKENGFRAIVFLPTGLMNNPGYLSWGQIAEAAGSGIYFANHTWSHKNIKAAKEVVEREISLADVQLTEHGLNSLKVFSYPYGLGNDYDRQFLQKLGYKLAFTTKPGSTLCQKLRYDLPRVRIGNSPISVYGF
jgi:peptidoglycan/xylan/chitin deacetylase (PgdA/CDA1 family)